MLLLTLQEILKVSMNRSLHFDVLNEQNVSEEQAEVHVPDSSKPTEMLPASDNLGYF